MNATPNGWLLLAGSIPVCQSVYRSICLIRLLALVWTSVERRI